jgi:hypothetical protein
MLEPNAKKLMLARCEIEARKSDGGTTIKTSYITSYMWVKKLSAIMKTRLSIFSRGFTNFSEATSVSTLPVTLLNTLLGKFTLVGFAVYTFALYTVRSAVQLLMLTRIIKPYNLLYTKNLDSGQHAKLSTKPMFL